MIGRTCPLAHGVEDGCYGAGDLAIREDGFKARRCLLRVGGIGDDNPIAMAKKRKPAAEGFLPRFRVREGGHRGIGSDLPAV